MNGLRESILDRSGQATFESRTESIMTLKLIDAICTPRRVDRQTVSDAGISDVILRSSASHSTCCAGSGGCHLWPLKDRCPLALHTPDTEDRRTVSLVVHADERRKAPVTSMADGHSSKH